MYQHFYDIRPIYRQTHEHPRSNGPKQHQGARNGDGPTHIHSRTHALTQIPRDTQTDTLTQTHTHIGERWEDKNLTQAQGGDKIYQHISPVVGYLDQQVEREYFSIETLQSLSIFWPKV